MSGGSLEYAYSRIECIADEVSRRAECPEHKAFAKHLYKVSKALHDLEWVWSGDCSEGDIESIMEVINPIDVLESTLIEAKVVLFELDRTIKEAESKK